jgi:ABC-type multidrug transport system permease subunit
MPLLQIHSSNLWGMFAISAFISAVTTVSAIYIQSIYSEITINGQKVHKKTDIKSSIIAFSLAFVSSMLASVVLYFIFDLKN